MKKNLKNKAKYVLGIAALMSFITAFPVLAENATGNTNTTNTSGMRRSFGRQGGNGENRGLQGMSGGNICNGISDMASDAEQRMAQMKSPEDRLNNWQQKTSEQDFKLTNLRSQWDNNRDAQFAKLKSRATTNDQKKAAADFEATTKAAISTRRAAVDAAMTTFREGVKSLINSRKQGITDNKTTFSDAMKAAFEKAKIDCQNNVDPATVRTNLQNALQAGRSQRQTERQALPKVGESIQSLIDARKQAVNKALDTFKIAMEEARIALKKAFPTE
jgi:hypothetical protein